jgi:hypothetical protein
MATPTITTAILNLIAVFKPHCEDRTTLFSLTQMVGQDRAQWLKAHHLFQIIGQKTLKAQRSGSQPLQAQYQFEEVSAKTLCNLSGGSAPFDAYVPFKIVPNAFLGPGN